MTDPSELRTAIETAIVNHTAAQYPDNHVIGTLRGVIGVEVAFDNGDETLEIIRLGTPYVWQEAGIIAALASANRQVMDDRYLTGPDDVEDQ